MGGLKHVFADRSEKVFWEGDIDPDLTFKDKSLVLNKFLLAYRFWKELTFDYTSIKSLSYQKYFHHVLKIDLNIGTSQRPSVRTLLALLFS